MKISSQAGKNVFRVLSIILIIYIFYMYLSVHNINNHPAEIIYDFDSLEQSKRIFISSFEEDFLDMLNFKNWEELENNFDIRVEEILIDKKLEKNTYEYNLYKNNLYKIKSKLSNNRID